MSKIDLFSLEITRHSFNLPPGVADARSVACVTFEEARRDYTLDFLTARQTLARMKTRQRMYHRATRRAQYR